MSLLEEAESQLGIGKVVLALVGVRYGYDFNGGPGMMGGRWGND